MIPPESGLGRAHIGLMRYSLVLLLVLSACIDPPTLTVELGTVETIPVDQSPDSGFLGDTAG